MECNQMSQYRNSCGIGPFIRAYKCTRPHISFLKLYALYLNDNSPENMLPKTNDLLHMHLGWHTEMKIPI